MCVGRYFVKEELPRIRYANPHLEIEVDKLNPSSPSHRTRDPSMVLEFSKYRPFFAFANLIQVDPANGPSKILPLSQKWSTQIVTDLMSIAGSPFIWSKWVEERTARGESLYVDRYGNGQGKEGYVKRPRVWRVGWARKAGYSRKEKGVETEEAVSLGNEKKEIEDRKTEGDELKTLLGLGTMPVETGPPKTGITTALP
jgi:hypothetical protein